MTYTVHTRPWDESKDRTYVAPDGKGFCNWHWKLTRTEYTTKHHDGRTFTSAEPSTVLVAEGFAATRDRARSKAERAAGKDQKRRAKADHPEESYEYEPE